MPSKYEKKALERYTDAGWKAFRGAPDYLLVRLDKNGKIIEFRFLEIKSDIRRLTEEQKIWKWVLEKKLMAKYTLHVEQLDRNIDYLRGESGPTTDEVNWGRDILLKFSDGVVSISDQ